MRLRSKVGWVRVLAGVGWWVKAEVVVGVIIEDF